ncbi:acid beta-fructofuranosidase precursor [Vigna radiata]|uniref:Acid beta-fructofuranosidase n=2 Tax=Vigna radiata TaxID=157791 RepID=INVA_VIGRR|nr:acid beta-fructofuranosidase precursor [Vigna radiata]P29001.1 RecName: Full=Acid beta-fructofuranosidase; AltName: Full=Acid invertase; Short=AI; AltName: Full=Acid sucrose hydrolase; AltName: Full=Vacuolar invertase; Contains: RecName: Full=Acid beta-fructofuranosidase 30 kDa subunit; Contains: RecName: Full=Acid beta-fructofuranosidase 38 kDa subunit; Contains: RecName: Full=Acid beta-fructofuranosidase 70 kDa monomer; Flags: Precursor [Vigna radiata var. radiata]BAA01107.1 invertase [Vigna
MEHHKPLLPTSSHAAPTSSTRKDLLFVLCGLLFLSSLVAYGGYRASGVPHAHLSSPTSNHQQDHQSPTSLPSSKWYPVSRGVSSGVSEKSSNLLFAGEGGASEAFPWDNSMLSWQRTSFHFQPEKNWMNDPNGPMYYKGWYHFFYQYNPNGAVWGDIVWGHAVSRDMIHWLHLPLAMVADQWYDKQGVWTGSATILPNGEIIMLYTGSTNESVQVQNLAYPADPSDPLLLDWIKHTGNPVLVPPPGIGAKDFRDPTTAWLTSEGKWRITIGSKLNKTGIALVYDTEDFKTYELKEGLLRAVPGTGMWECVDFFPVSKKNGNGLDTSVNGAEVKHVMKVSLDDDRHDYYAIGTYDDNKVLFTPDDVKNDVGVGLRYDYGIFYASKTFYDQNKDRRILWGWIGESDSEYADVTKGWASVQSIPRTVRLDTKTGSNLLQWPVDEVESLRLRSDEFKSLKAKPGSVVSLDIETATQLDVVAEFEIDTESLEKTAESNEEFTCSSSGGAAQRGALGPFGLLVLADEGLSEYTPVYFYVIKGRNGNLRTSFCSDQSRSSQANDVRKQIFGSVVPVLKGEKFSLRMLVDHSIVESFAQGGRTCVTSRVYPTKAIYGAARLFLFNNATEATVTASLKVWQMNSAFIRPFPFNPDQKS